MFRKMIDPVKHAAISREMAALLQCQQLLKWYLNRHFKHHLIHKRILFWYTGSIRSGRPGINTGGINMFDTMKIAGKIRQARIDKNMTQMALADEMGVSYQAVSNWERGNSMPDISKLEDLCRVLELDVTELLGMDAPETGRIRQVIRGENADLTVEELAELAPLLPPEQVKKQTDGARKEGKKLNISALAGLAPFLDANYLDELVADAKAEDLEEVLTIAPFLSAKALDTVVEKCAAQENYHTICALAPFLSAETLGKLVRNAEEGADFDTVIGLAPFLDSTALDALVERCTEKADINGIRNLAPFLGSETLNKLVMEAMDTAELDTIKDLAPFLSKETVDVLAERMLREGKGNPGGLYPFMSRKGLRALADKLMRERDLAALAELLPFV